jgi:hypothetical protein
MKSLKTQLEESSGAIERIKAELAARVLAGEQVPASELDAVVKVEVKLRNLAAFERVRELTSQ